MVGSIISMLIHIIACGAGLFLAYANGANDNFKGVATLFGSGTVDYKKALIWATLTTALGSITAIVLAQGLLAAFSGKGLVPDAVVASKSFALAVGLSAAFTVMLATRFGLPVSTTHALTGALVGAGLLASADGVNFAKLGSTFFMPLLVSPVLAIGLAIVFYPLAHFARAKFGVSRELCVCVGTEVVTTVPLGTSHAQALSMAAAMPSLALGTEATCEERYQGKLLGINAGTTLDGLHVLSAGIVSFARGLNDTPKIATVFLIGGAIAPSFAIIATAVLIAVGGIISAKKVAETMSHKVTKMNPGQGFSANLITGLLVIGASRLGLPISTTHVSCGAIFGVGAVTRQANVKTITGILVGWATTLPLAAGVAALVFLVLRPLLT